MECRVEGGGGKLCFLPMAELGVLESDFDPIADTFGAGFAAEALEADAVVDLFGGQVVVRHEQDDGRFLAFREETVKELRIANESNLSQVCKEGKLAGDSRMRDEPHKLLSALLASVLGVGVHLGDGRDVLTGPGDADDRSRLDGTGALVDDVVDVHLAVGDVSLGFQGGVFER